ncbi:MAG: MFS transporter [Acidimicrobiales bacterium]|jgi:MFS family permease
MSDTSAAGVAEVAGGPPQRWTPRMLIDRDLHHYPSTGKRVWYLAVVVVATIVLYYEAYAPGSVSPLVLAHYHMTFSYYLYSTIIGSAFGAISSLIGAWGDRYGRANLIVAGVGVVALLQLFAVPNMPNKLSWVSMIIIIGFCEGIILVNTPAVVRDFTAQHGRASAMGFWTLGPVAGSFIVSVVSRNTLPVYHDWQSQFDISGIVGIGMFLVALFFLRELSPEIRDQLMVSTRERVLVEAKAKGIDIESAIAHPWKQMFKWDLVISSVGISLFLLIYFAAIGFFTLFFTVTFHNKAGVFLTTAQADGINQWFWGFNAAALIVIGLLSDRVRVRKPFMLVGAIGVTVMTIIFLYVTSRPLTSYDTLIVITSFMAVFLGTGFVPWFAAFTETVEAHNPALMATGLAIEGWALRVVVAVSTLVVALTVTSVTTIVNNAAYAKYAGKAKAILAKHGALVALASKHAAILKSAAAHPHDAAIIGAAAKAVGGLPNLIAISKIGPELAFLAKVGPHLTALGAAIASSPAQWQHWYWVCAAGAVVFIPTIFVNVGRWSPAKAKADSDAHEALINEELAKLAGSTAKSGADGAQGGPAAGTLVTS